MSAPAAYESELNANPRPGFGDTAESGLVVGGRIYAVCSALVSIIIMIVMIIMGYKKINDPHRAIAPMTVTKVVSCTSALMPSVQNNAIFMCVVNVSFVDGNGVTYAPVGPISVNVHFPAQVGDILNLLYDPDNPTSITQGPPRVLGKMLIGGGLAVGTLGVGLAVLAFKSRGFAMFEGAAGLINVFRN